MVHGEETTLDGDKAYYKADDKTHREVSGGRYRVNRSGSDK